MATLIWLVGSMRWILMWNGDGMKEGGGNTGNEEPRYSSLDKHCRDLIWATDSVSAG